METLQQQQIEKPPKKFPSYLDSTDLSPRARTVCEMLATVYPNEVETALSTMAISFENEVIEEVLRYSYGYPAAAMIFFNWIGFRRKYSVTMWNLIVDLLGKNKMFDPMWDVIKSMKEERALSLTTFVSVFESYCEAKRFNDATMTFELMENYGVKTDFLAVNSLLRAICCVDLEKAYEFFEKVNAKMPLDGVSYAILLEACEKDGNVSKAKTIFGEMVIRVGFSPENIAAYDAFLNTLVRDSKTKEALDFLKVMKGKNCLPGLKFFSNAIDFLVNQNDSVNALSLWDFMVTSGVIPNLSMYNSMIGFLCSNNELDHAFKLLDEMPFHGVFADSLTYNIIFQFLIKNKKLKEAGKFFVEMIKNEQPPSPENCAAAISMFFDGDDPETAFEIWVFMKKDRVTPIEDGANAFLTGLANMGRISELRRNAESMLKVKITIYESTMRKLKIACLKQGKKAAEVYDDLERKWRYP